MKSTILLVDDNPQMLEVVSEQLDDRYEVLTAANGKQALEILEKEIVHLVVSDVMMPVMDGFELCKTIKTHFEYTHIPVILLTAKNTLQARIAGLEHGADAYIDKPFDVDYLLVQIASLLANRKKLMEYYSQSPSVFLAQTGNSKEDELFLQTVYHAIEEDMDNPELSVDVLAGKLNMSRTSFFRRVKTLTDLSPHDLINITRLKKAAALLSEGRYKIYEVSDMVGFSSQTHFGRSFFKQYGMTPTEWLKRGV